MYYHLDYLSVNSSGVINILSGSKIVLVIVECPQQQNYIYNIIMLKRHTMYEKRKKTLFHQFNTIIPMFMESFGK